MEALCHSAVSLNALSALVSLCKDSEHTLLMTDYQHVIPLLLRTV